MLWTRILKILWKRREIAPEEQLLLFSTIFFYLLLDFHVKAGIRFSLRDKRLFEISEFEITRVNCICDYAYRTYTVDSRYLEFQGAIKYFEISVPRRIRFAELRKKLFEQPHLTNIHVIGLLKLEIY